MTTIAYCFDRLCDRELLAEVKRLALSERQATAHLVASLAEFDARRLYLGEGCSSLFTYCRDVLHLSEHAAYNRIEAARVARRFPLILERLADGSVHLTAIRLLDRHLTSENYREVLDAARHKSKLEVLQLIARIDPKPDVAASVHKLAAPATATSVIDTTTAAADSEATELKLTTVNVASAPPQRLSEITPLAPERFKVQFTVSKETHDKLRRAQDLMRHRIPDGDPAAIFDRALTVLLAELERTKLAAAKRPRGAAPTSSTARYVPAAVKRVVWERDGGQCTFVGGSGRCRETGFLEFHHVIPYSTGGGTTVENLELRCRAHNVYEAEQYFGRGTLFVRERSSAWWGNSELVPERKDSADVRGRNCS